MSKVRVEIIRRMIFSKSLFREAKAACSQKNDQFTLARGILLLHDAVESALSAVADHLHARIKERNYLLGYFDCIEEADELKRKLPHRTQIVNLNTIRKDIKHHGILPDPREADPTVAAAESLLVELAEAYLGLDYLQLSLKDLIQESAVRSFVEKAETYAEKEQFEQALIALGYAVYHITESWTIPWMRDLFVKAEERAPVLFTEPYGKDFIVTLLEHGVDPFTYYRFRNLTPRLGRVTDSGKVVYHWDKEYGHPGNWTRKNVQFCLDFCVDVALKFEKRPSYEYDLVSYREIFEDEIVPTGDKAVFWNRPQKLNEKWLPGAKPPSRKPILELSPGATVKGVAYDDGPDLSEWRVLSYDIPGVPDHPGIGYVAKNEVEVRSRRIGNDGSQTR